MKPDHVILGIHVTDRLHKANDLQKVLTEFGANIKTRLGLHETGEGYSSPGGIVLLELVGSMEELVTLRAKLQGIVGLEIQQMLFSHE
ncbi:hypothetical protein [Holophaga foetida]|uniref:hypothetical protein n=1 Tax=Holophaga foetida TaxID=35839 RepID=UPI0002475327|nr:hypothetical protein [Holophaga foetida]